ncbi:hypothetical protein C8R45DRAFT_1213477 [Mycena sanguinolenta]|nr:hypothetical protein C8R45DRAFT_1213477 [Mycena sanguinolenta]
MIGDQLLCGKSGATRASHLKTPSPVKSSFDFKDLNTQFAPTYKGRQRRPDSSCSSVHSSSFCSTCGQLFTSPSIFLAGPYTRFNLTTHSSSIMLFNAAVLSVLALSGSSVAAPAPHRRPKGAAVGTTVIATGPNAQATAVSTNGGPAVAETFGRRQLDLGSIFASLEAQAEGALATGGGGDFTFATTIIENQPAATGAAGDDAGDNVGDNTTGDDEGDDEGDDTGNDAANSAEQAAEQAADFTRRKFKKGKKGAKKAKAAKQATAAQGAQGAQAAGTTVIATGPNAQATAVSTNGGPAVAEAFGRRQIDLGSIFASLEAQAEGALATGGSGDFTFATTITEAPAAATGAAGDDTGDDAGDDTNGNDEGDDEGNDTGNDAANSAEQAAKQAAEQALGGAFTRRKFKKVKGAKKAKAAKQAATGQGAQGAQAAGTTVIATGPNAQATAVSTNGGPVVAESFGRRQIDINSILSSLEAQAEGALATGGGGDFTFATTIVENQPAATDAAGEDTTDDGADDAAAPTATQATTTTKKGGKKAKGAKKA